MISWLFGKPKYDWSSFSSIKTDETACRICFEDSHRSALKPYGNGKYPYKFAIPFDNGIGSLLAAKTGIRLHNNDMGPWVELTAEQEPIVRKWMEEQGGRVFVRDFFDVSICLGMNFDGHGKHSAIGLLEYQAKYERSKTAIDQLVEILANTIADIPAFERTGHLGCIPPRQGKDFDLPSVLANKLCAKMSKTLITIGSWKNEKQQLKQVARENKWQCLENAGFEPNPQINSISRLIVLDDLYQSGATLNFVGGKLKETTDCELYGLCVVKSMRDTDNT